MRLLFHFPSLKDHFPPGLIIFVAKSQAKGALFANSAFVKDFSAKLSFSCTEKPFYGIFP